jgi:hypothetical protein
MVPGMPDRSESEVADPTSRPRSGWDDDRHTLGLRLVVRADVQGRRRPAGLRRGCAPAIATRLLFIDDKTLIAGFFHEAAHRTWVSTNHGTAEGRRAHTARRRGVAPVGVNALAARSDLAVESGLSPPPESAVMTSPRAMGSRPGVTASVIRRPYFAGALTAGSMAHRALAPLTGDFGVAVSTVTSAPPTQAAAFAVRRLRVSIAPS